MNKLLKRITAAALAVASALTLSGCGQERTVFSDIDALNQITEGSFNLGVNFKTTKGFNEQPLNVSAQILGSFTDTSLSIEIPSFNVDAGSSDAYIGASGLKLIVVDKKMYIPVDTINQISRLVSSTSIPTMSDANGDPIEWIYFDAQDLAGSTIPSGAIQFELSNVDTKAVRSYIADTLLPELKDSFGSLGSKIMYVDSGNAHFVINQDTVTEFIDALKKFVQDGSYAKVYEGAITFLGETPDAKPDTESITNQIDTLLSSIPNDVIYTIDLTTAVKDNKSSYQLTANLKQGSDTIEAYAGYEVDNKKVNITAPTKGIIKFSDLMSMYVNS